MDLLADAANFVIASPRLSSGFLVPLPLVVVVFLLSGFLLSGFLLAVGFLVGVGLGVLTPVPLLFAFSLFCSIID